MPRPPSRPNGRGEFLWKLYAALFVAGCFALASYFHLSLSTRRHVFYGPDHNLGEAVIAGALTFVACLLILYFPAKKTDSSKRRALEAAFHGVAGRLGGTVTPARWPQPPRIHFPAHGHSATLEFSPDGSREGTTRVTVDLRGCSPGMLMIFRDGIGSFIPKLFGAQDLPVGDPPFDRRFVIRANPESIAQRIFRPDRRALAIGSVMRVDGLPDATIHVSRDCLTVRAGSYLNREGELWALASTALEFTRYILDLEPPARISWGESSIGGGDCPICGSPLESGIVRCVRCRTPHHAECWKYNSRCSIFGCGELRFTNAPKGPSRNEPNHKG